MDVYTTSFNVYPFAVPSPTTATPSSYPSHQRLPASSQPLNQQVSSSSGFPNPAIAIGSGGDLVSAYAQQTQQNGMPLQQQQQQFPPHSHVPTHANHSPPHPNSANNVVHRHHSTLSGVELVWEHLHRLTLHAMTQYPGTHITFSRTANNGGGVPSGSGSSSNSSEDSLTLLGTSSTAASGSSPMLSSISSPSPSIPNPVAPNANTTPIVGGLHASISNPALNQVPSSLSTPTLVSLAVSGVPGAVAGAGVISANANASLHNGPHTRGTAFFNFTITGSSQTSVMGARGLILRDAPVQNRSVIRVARSEILEPPTATRGSGNRTGNGGGTSSVPMPGTGSGALKQPVIQRLDEIAAQTRANISVLKTSSSSSSVAFAYSAYPYPNSNPNTPSTWSSSSLGRSGAGHGGVTSGSFGGANAAAQAAGLEGEKTCELIITGPGDTVDVARLRLLVMLDELVSFLSLFALRQFSLSHAFSVTSFLYFPQAPLAARFLGWRCIRLLARDIM